MMKNNCERIPSLDGLRAISILLVVFSHVGGNLGYPVYTLGNLGVRIFFIISGFLITSILLSEVDRTSTLNLKKFYFRRTLRIFPAYYFFLLIVFIMSLWGIYQISYSTFLLPLFYISNYLAPLPWELGHTWSLSVEEQFYLFFPGILLILGKYKTKKLLIYIILIVPFLRFFHALYVLGEYLPFWVEFSFHTNMDALATGCLLALCRETLHKNRFHQEFLRSMSGVVALSILCIVIVFYYFEYTVWYNLIGVTILNFSIVLCIDWLILNHMTRLGKILNSGPFVKIGMLSYSIYLWQQPFTKYSEDKIWTHFPYNVMLFTLLSLFSYYIVEKGFLDLRKNLELSLFPKRKEDLKVQIVLQDKTI
jgi:peptidoglycan/LPS O-acetylase OafA/YrhL